MSDDHGFKPGSVLDGRYRLLDILGEGGFGVVFRATQLSSGQMVAVKLLRRARLDGSSRGDAESKRFKRELDVVGRLRHPNIVGLVDSGETEFGDLYAVLELVEGVSLHRALKDDGPLKLGETIHAMRQVLDALCCAHESGVIHRDLKPANIMLSRGGLWRNATVLDFGIASLMRSAQNTNYTALTSTGQFPGTPQYMSPEQLKAEPITPRVDIYAWGLVFIEAITGVPVITGSSVAAIYYRQMAPEPVPIPKELDGTALAVLLAKATRKHPEERYPTALAALADLDAIDPGELAGAVDAVATAETGALEAISTDGHRPREPIVNGSEPTAALSALSTPSTGPPTAFAATAAELDVPNAREGSEPPGAYDSTLAAAPVVGRQERAREERTSNNSNAPAQPKRNTLALLAVVLVLVLGLCIALFLVLTLASRTSDTTTDQRAESANTPQMVADATPGPGDLGTSREERPPVETHAAHQALDAQATAIPSDVGATPVPDAEAPLDADAIESAPNAPLTASQVASSIVDIAGTQYAFCVITDTKLGRCWGANWAGQMGAGIFSELNDRHEVLPRTVPHMTGATLLYDNASTLNFCVRDGQDEAYCWGGTDFPFETGPNYTTKRTPWLDSAVVASIGEAHACAIDEHGVLGCHGTNYGGALGVRDGLGGLRRISAVVEAPAGVPSEKWRFASVAVGAMDSCGVLISGELYCWGARSYELANPSQAHLVAPKARSAALSRLQLCYSTGSGAVRCTNDPNWRTTENWATLDGPTDVIQLSTDKTFTCALERDGEVWCWGRSEEGQLGEKVEDRELLKAKKIEGLPPIKRLATSLLATCALTQDGQGVWCWGNNSEGQLGDGTFIDRMEPVPVKGLLEELDRILPTDAALDRPAATPLPSSLPATCATNDRTVTFTGTRPPSESLDIQTAYVWRNNLVPVITMQSFVGPARHTADVRGGETFVRLEITTHDQRDALLEGARVKGGTAGDTDVVTAYVVNRAGAVGGPRLDASIHITHADSEWVCGEFDVTHYDWEASGKFVAKREPPR